MAAGDDIQDVANLQVTDLEMSVVFDVMILLLLFLQKQSLVVLLTFPGCQSKDLSDRP